MNRRQKIVGVALVLLLLGIIWGQRAEGKEVSIRGAGGTVQTWDLMDMGQRVEFRALYGNQVGHCFERADYAKGLAERRDKGETEADHLAEVRANYERTKTEPRGAVSRAVYVDFQRMVRDIHRTDSSGYQWKDVNEIWEREVWWCIFPGQTAR